MEHLRCVVERITYQNTENGYSVIKCRVKGFSELVAVVGTMPDVHVGSVLNLGGGWKVDSKYGRQFEVETWEETLPATAFGMEKYLGSGLIKGIGPKFAKRIVGKFGKDTLEIIECEPDRLLEVEGIGKQRVDKIKESWVKQKEIKNIMIFLQNHDVSTAHATKIYKSYGESSIEIVRENPYKLADDIWGIGFKTADIIASKMGFGHEKYVRLRAGIIFTLNKLADLGHCYATKEMIFEEGAKLLEVSPELIVMTLDEMIKDGDVFKEDLKKEKDDISDDNGAKEKTDISDDNGAKEKTDISDDNGAKEKTDVSDDTDAGEIQEVIYLPPFYYAERGTALKLRKLMSEKSFMANEVEDHLKRGIVDKNGNAGEVQSKGDFEKKSMGMMLYAMTGMEYDDTQILAIKEAISNKVFVLTGGPGTGKTTTTLGIITAFKAAGAKIVLAAPTGRAAKRLSETTGMEAKTIHRLLEIKPPNGYKRNEENPLEGDVLIVDECSMIDILLMYNLMKAIPENMTFIMVGDVDQLPSVGAGNVLADILNSGVIPSVKLEKIFRQAKGSRIIMNAHRINKGEAIEINNSGESDFFFTENDAQDQVARTIVNFCKNNLPRYYKANPMTDIQVLTPMQRGEVGAVNLNQMMQEAMNPNNLYLTRSGTKYKLKDKVMQIRNNYDKEVFNGDIGFISDVNLDDKELTVDFYGRQVEYDSTELDELVLAYATTIHKAQGSEYPIVVMPFMMSHYIMLQRNLLYTGVTRAKKVLVLIGQRRAVKYAIENNKAVERNTALALRLRDMEVMQKTEVGAPGGVGELFRKLGRSEFRSKFRLEEEDREYISQKGIDNIRLHAVEFVRERLSPANPKNDGKQTPMKGHPVFIAQHATATCCRGCLFKWHNIPQNRELTEKEQEYIVGVIMSWIERRRYGED